MGYTRTNPPHLIIETPGVIKEDVTGASNVQGFSGIITGISTTTGTGGHPLALKINFRALKDYTVGGEAQLASDALDLLAGYPIMVYDTKVGSGVTSVFDSNNSVVAIGNTFLDNVYVVSQKSFENGPDAELILNIHTDSPVVGIATTDHLKTLRQVLQQPLLDTSLGVRYITTVSVVVEFLSALLVLQLMLDYQHSQFFKEEETKDLINLVQLDL